MPNAFYMLIRASIAVVFGLLSLGCSSNTFAQTDFIHSDTCSRPSMLPDLERAFELLDERLTPLAYNENVQAH